MRKKIKQKYFLSAFLSLWLAAGFAKNTLTDLNLKFDNQQFRDGIVSFIQHQVLQENNVQSAQFQELEQKIRNHYQIANWTLEVSCYQEGRITHQGSAEKAQLRTVLVSAINKMEPVLKTLANCRFKVDFAYYPNRHYAFISAGNKALELTGNRVAVRQVTSARIREQIKNSTEYLLRVMHPRLYGFYKFYDAAQDKPETFLRTIYSASALYTLMKIQDVQPNPEIERLFKPIAHYILAQQITSGANKGAFYYAFYPDKNQHQQRLVVGTASKTIFTLLKLHQRYPDDTKYLDAAKAAGNWLMSQVMDDGRVIAIQTYNQQKWVQNTKQSLLYSGQVLSALSRLYLVTKNPRYRQKAQRIADSFVQKVREEGAFLGDEYRPANSISSSWVMMSLMDFTHVNPAPEYLNTINRIALKLKSMQYTDPQDIYYLGKFWDAMTTSGNGWINEVFGEYYPFCQKMRRKDCEGYKQSMILSTRWLLQNAYTEENTFNIKNPQQAIGGFILKYYSHQVRTDAVCHGINSFISLLGFPDTSEVLLDVKEIPLAAILPLLRAGNIQIP